MITRLLAAFLCITALCGCSSVFEQRMERNVDRMRSDELAKIDQEQCKAEGGLIRGVGIFGTPACVKPYPDAGKTCSDRSECQGLCKSIPDAVIGSSPATGTCQRDTHDIFGCYNEIKAGVVVAGMCVD